MLMFILKICQQKSQMTEKLLSRVDERIGER